MQNNSCTGQSPTVCHCSNLIDVCECAHYSTRVDNVDVLSNPANVYHIVENLGEGLNLAIWGKMPILKSPIFRLCHPPAIV